jgi:hypothetical protein
VHSKGIIEPCSLPLSLSLSLSLSLILSYHEVSSLLNCMLLTVMYCLSTGPKIMGPIRITCEPFLFLNCFILGICYSNEKLTNTFYDSYFVGSLIFLTKTHQSQHWYIWNLKQGINSIIKIDNTNLPSFSF